MSAGLDGLDGLESDMTHLKVLIEVATEHLIDTTCDERATALMWVIRDLAEKLVADVAACHQKVMVERCGDQAVN